MRKSIKCVTIWKIQAHEIQGGTKGGGTLIVNMPKRIGNDCLTGLRPM